MRTLPSGCTATVRTIPLAFGSKSSEHWLARISHATDQQSPRVKNKDAGSLADLKITLGIGRYSSSVSWREIVAFKLSSLILVLSSWVYAIVRFLAHWTHEFGSVLITGERPRLVLQSANRVYNIAGLISYVAE